MDDVEFEKRYKTDPDFIAYREHCQLTVDIAQYLIEKGNSRLLLGMIASDFRSQCSSDLFNKTVGGMLSNGFLNTSDQRGVRLVWLSSKVAQLSGMCDFHIAAYYLASLSVDNGIESLDASALPAFMLKDSALLEQAVSILEMSNFAQVVRNRGAWAQLRMLPQRFSLKGNPRLLLGRHSPSGLTPSIEQEPTHMTSTAWDKSLMRRILTDISNRSQSETPPFWNYRLDGVEQKKLMRYISELSNRGWLRIEDVSTLNEEDFAPIALTASGVSWLEEPIPGVMAGGAEIHHHYHAPVVNGDNANIATATNSPGAGVTAATGNVRVQQNIRNEINEIRRDNNELATALTKIAEAITASIKLSKDQKLAAEEQLEMIVHECSLPVDRRKSPGTLKLLTSGLRELLAFASDVAQVTTTNWPVVLANLHLTGLL